MNTCVISSGNSMMVGIGNDRNAMLLCIWPGNSLSYGMELVATWKLCMNEPSMSLTATNGLMTLPVSWA